MTYYDISLSWYNSDGTQGYIEDVNVTKDPQEKIPLSIIKKTEEEISKNENIPFFNADGNDIEQLNNDNNEEDNEDDDEDDEDDKKKNKNEDEDDDDDDED